MRKAATMPALGPVSDGGNEAIGFSQPYTLKVEIEGVCPIIFHRWNPEAIEEKARLPKNSRGKREDNIESYVWRDEKGMLGLPGEYFRQSIINAAKFMQDPRSPRKSAMDLFKAGLVVHTELALFGVKTWDYLDKRRVTIQRQGINRIRPALHKGWRLAFEVEVVLPEYITRELLLQVIGMAGRLVGLSNFRPTYGRFVVVKVID